MYKLSKVQPDSSSTVKLISVHGYLMNNIKMCQILVRLERFLIFNRPPTEHISSSLTLN